jgi:hypothetical protein
MQIYQRAQIRHCWLVEPEEKTLECFSLHDHLYALVAFGMDGESSSGVCRLVHCPEKTMEKECSGSLNRLAGRAGALRSTAQTNN